MAEENQPQTEATEQQPPAPQAETETQPASQPAGEAQQAQPSAAEQAPPAAEGQAPAEGEPVVEEAPELERLGEPSAVASGELPIGLRALIDAGVHFGHQTKRWNPRMRPYIYGARNGIHIIDLDQTAQLFKRAFEFVSDQVARGGHVLFVGTKRQAADVIEEEATRAGQFFATGRWLGGTLTNFRTVKGGIERLRELERMEEEGELLYLPKKEAISLQRERLKLDKYIGGIKMMNAVPSVMFIIDPHHEHIAVNEGRKLHIPIVALTDTNCDPDLIDFVIPGNDDAIRSIKLITSRIADACVEGQGRRKEMMAQQGYGAQQAAGGVPVEFQRGRRGRRGGAGGR